MIPALFLDRDGVIIENKINYVRSIDDITFFDQALLALKRLKSSNLKIFLVTNQSAVGRGIISLSTAVEINHYVFETIQKHDGRIDEVFMCPHAPKDNCYCRKPRPGMILEAAEKHNVDLAQSILIGDALSDLGAGKASGIKNLILLLTGRGQQQLLLPESEKYRPFLVLPDLLSAVDYVENLCHF